MTRNAYGEPATAANHDAPGPVDHEDSIFDVTSDEVLLPILKKYIGEEMGYQSYDKLVEYVERAIAERRV